MAQAGFQHRNRATDCAFGKFYPTLISRSDDKTFQNSQVCAFRKVDQMNARVFLLMLVTAAFMGIWDADRPAETLVRVSRSNHPPAASAVMKSSRITSFQLDMSTTNSSSVHGTVVTRSPASETLIPMPKGLQSGTWHAFNHEGDTMRITIERNSAESHSVFSDEQSSSVSSNEACVITGMDGVRWCFVKEQSTTTR